MSAEIIVLADHREKLADTAPSEMALAGVWSDDAIQQAKADLAYALQVAEVALAMDSLTRAAAIATTPIWPGGIDDLEIPDDCA